LLIKENGLFVDICLTGTVRHNRGRQFLFCKSRSFGQYDATLYDILKFAYVSRPGIVVKEVESFSSELYFGISELLTGFLRNGRQVIGYLIFSGAMEEA